MLVEHLNGIYHQLFAVKVVLDVQISIIRNVYVFPFENIIWLDSFGPIVIFIHVDEDTHLHLV